MINFINTQYTTDSRTLKTIRHLMSLCFCVCEGGGVTVFVECWVGEIYILLLGTEHRWCEDPIESALFIIIILPNE